MKEYNTFKACFEQLEFVGYIDQSDGLHKLENNLAYIRLKKMIFNEGLDALYYSGVIDGLKQAKGISKKQVDKLHKTNLEALNEIVQEDPDYIEQKLSTYPS